MADKAETAGRAASGCEGTAGRRPPISDTGGRGEGSWPGPPSVKQQPQRRRRECSFTSVGYNGLGEAAAAAL